MSFVRIHTKGLKKSQKKLHIPIEMQQTVEELKEKIYEKTKIKESIQVLKFKQEQHIAILKDQHTLKHYGVEPNSVIILFKYGVENEDEKERIEERGDEEEEEEEESNGQVMDINKRIDFYGMLDWNKKRFEMDVIREEKDEDFEEGDEDAKIVVFQRRFLNFSRNNIKVWL